jgi:signal transduction histidine kinase
MVPVKQALRHRLTRGRVEKGAKSGWYMLAWLVRTMFWQEYKRFDPGPRQARNQGTGQVWKMRRTNRKPGRKKTVHFTRRTTVEDAFSLHGGVNGRIDERLLEQLAFNEKMAELGKLATGMVHELNTPLSVIVSAAQMILRENDLSEFNREMLERIDLEAQRLSQFTKGLLSFARRSDEAATESDLNQVLQEVMKFLRYEAQKRSISVIEELDYHIPPVLADANHLKQVFINLIMNALQAMEQGGMLLLRTLQPNDTTVEIQIADTGTGIPGEALGRIFEPFFTTKKEGSGTGLGLFITRTIVERTGGRIRVQSVAGEGTTFTLSFPVAP